MNIDKKIFKRTKRSIKCLSFNSNFYKDTEAFGLMAEKVFELRTKYLLNQFNFFLNPSKIENDFQWLINIGVLRREVDGQGLTSKVRLTPLGREVLKQRPGLPEQKPYFCERLIDFIFRSYSESFWSFLDEPRYSFVFFPKPLKDFCLVNIILQFGIGL